MTQLTLFEASQELRVQANSLIQHKPIQVEIIKDLSITSERLRKHAQNLVGYRSELAAILAELERLDSQPQTPDALCPMDRWRFIAREFHCLRTCMDKGLLHADFEPADLVRLRKKQAFTPAQRGVFAFLLHIWNSSNRFDLAETQRWDCEHLGAFRRWVSGQSTGGDPCRYF